MYGVVLIREIQYRDRKSAYLNELKPITRDEIGVVSATSSTIERTLATVECISNSRGMVIVSFE